MTGEGWRERLKSRGYAKNGDLTVPELGYPVKLPSDTLLTVCKWQ